MDQYYRSYIISSLIHITLSITTTISNIIVAKSCCLSIDYHQYIFCDVLAGPTKEEVIIFVIGIVICAFSFHWLLGCYMGVTVDFANFNRS